MIYTAETPAENYDSTRFHLGIIASMLADVTLDHPLLVPYYVEKYREARADHAFASSVYLDRVRASVSA